MNEIRKILGNLGNPMDEGEFYQKIQNLNYCVNKSDIKVVLGNTEKFVKRFGSFLKNEEFKNQIFEIIQNSYDICESINDLPKILENTTINRLTEILLKTKTKEVRTILGESFKNLLPGPQILNLTVLVNSVLKDKKSLEELKNLDEKEIKYKAEMTEAEKRIKLELDSWIQNLDIDLKQQNELIESLKYGLHNLAEIKGIDVNSENYKKLEEDCVEMLTMQFISASLLDELNDEDLNPIPIN